MRNGRRKPKVVRQVKSARSTKRTARTAQHPKFSKPRKVLLLGSGALKIGEAGEFDYSGSQAIKALQQEGIKIILVNPNIATIQTSEGLADRVYFLPITPEFVERIIIREQPDSILLSFGGQTALNCGVALAQQGILDRHNVRVLGTSVQTIIDTEDRERFVQRLAEINLKTARSKAVTTVSDGLVAADTIGYPVMVRVAYALGGLGSGVAYNRQELEQRLTHAFTNATQALVEEYLHGWKEIEYEVVRDVADNCITVCNMENLDPMGIHTGESIVVAPSQTLSNAEYHKLRTIALRTIRHLGIVGECNIQYALDPHSDDYRIIEVNARLSRSSALASKATGYPLAFVAAKLALGYTLPRIRNSITRVTAACFEPALDYVVVKIPRWDLKKFPNATRQIGSGMKSVGEVMAIGRTFEEAIQKAIRMLGIGMHGLVANRLRFTNLPQELSRPTDERIFAVVEAFAVGMPVDTIHELTRIDRWFLYKIRNIVEIATVLQQHTLATMPKELLRSAKQRGFSDFQIARLCCGPDARHPEALQVRALRKHHHLFPVVKQIDTLAAEYPAKTNYLYCTYNGERHDVSPKQGGIVVLGSGAYRIGSSVEFDWCAVSAVQTLTAEGKRTIMINCNPETVSTDYDICDALYFEELTFERVLDIIEFEKPTSTLIAMGGQTPNNLALRLHAAKVRLLGTTAAQIDRAEDRHKFSTLLDTLSIAQPAWRELSTIESAKAFAQEVGYPVLVRPSYVLSGAAMRVAFDDGSLEEYLATAAAVSREHPVVISKFVINAHEIEFDGVAKRGKLIRGVITEHVENAGVHSGDATMVLPPQRIYTETLRRVRETARAIAAALQITGPFNIQFLAKSNEVLVIECNLRASRSFPFVSKVLKDNFITAAVQVMLGRKVESKDYSLVLLPYVCIKSPQFSFMRLSGAEPILGVEMTSTGEVACFGESIEEAFLKSVLSSGYRLPKQNVLISISGDFQRFDFLGETKQLAEMGFTIYATEHTSAFLTAHHIANTMIYKAHNPHKPNNAGALLESGKLDFAIAVPDPGAPAQSTDHAVLRRKAVDRAVPLILNLQLAKLFVRSIVKLKIKDLEIKAWDEYTERKVFNTRSPVKREKR